MNVSHLFEVGMIDFECNLGFQSVTKDSISLDLADINWMTKNLKEAKMPSKIYNKSIELIYV